MELRRRHRRGSGFALILVLLLLALLIVLVYSFAYSTRVNLRLARNRAADLKVTYLGKAGIEIAKALLKSDAKENDHDWLGDKWAERIPPIEFEGATIQVEIVDEDRKINVNGLVLDRASLDKKKLDADEVRGPILKRIERAIALLDLPVDAARLTERIGAQVRSGDGESVRASLPFLGRPLHSIEELLEFEEVEPQMVYGEEREHGRDRMGLMSVLTVASTGPVNLNTAPREVLMALSEELTEAMADAIIARRKETEGFKSPSDLAGVKDLPKTALADLQASGATQSSVFSLSVAVRRGPMRRLIRCTLQRPASSEVDEDAPMMPIIIPGLDQIRILRWEEVR